jgi:hypothetical protein
MTDNTEKAWELASEIVKLNSEQIVIAVLANYIEDALNRQVESLEN